MNDDTLTASSFVERWIPWIAMLGLCAAYIQGPLDKIFDFPSAIAEMNKFGLSPAPQMAIVVIIFELGCSSLILTGILRWLGALGLAGFTLMATFVALRFWELPMPERTPAANAFFEHFGLIGGFLLVAWNDFFGVPFRRRRTARPASQA